MVLLVIVSFGIFVKKKKKKKKKKEKDNNTNKCNDKTTKMLVLTPKSSNRSTKKSK